MNAAERATYEVERLCEENRWMQARIAAALDLHRESWRPAHRGFCLCGAHYPCETGRALGVTE